MLTLVRVLLAVAGAAAVGYLVAVTGVEALVEPVRALSWRVAVILLFPYVLVFALHTLAWRLAFARAAVPFGRLLAVRLAGEAVNSGAASVGGEPVKVLLLRPSVPLVEASAAQVVDKTGITIGQVLFLGIGFAVALPVFDFAPGFLRAMTVLLAIQVLLVAGLVVAQGAGAIGGVVRVLGRFGLGPGHRAQGLLQLDRELTAAYRGRAGRVVACILAHLAGWLTGSLEVYLVLQWLGVGGSFLDALVIDAFATGIKFMAFAVPGQLGALEGGFMFAFAALGFGGALGLSFTLVRRLRMVAWIVAGLVVLALLKSPPTDAVPSTPSPAHPAGSRS